MSKRLILVLALVFALGLTAGAYAEVQNVKVSGDITMKAVSRNDFDLLKTVNGGNALNDEQDSFLSIARIKIDADLTDNVSTTVRLINERDWDGDTNTTAAAQEIDIDLAYVNLKEFLYSPLSVTLGRQELRYGNALVIGDPDTNNLSGTSGLTYGDLSMRKAFDAAKAVLNYDPLVVDLIYAKVSEAAITGANVNDDVNLYGVNANYALDKQTTLEGYFFSRTRGSNATVFTAAQRTTGAALTNASTKHDSVHTLGARAVNTSIKNLTAQAEGALQFGSYNPGYDINALNAVENRNRKAWAAQVVADYNLADVLSGIAKYNPSLMGTYTYLSGEKNTNIQGGTYSGWDPMFEDQTLGHIVNRIMGYTNSQILTFSAKVTPVEDVTFNVDYANYWLNKGYPSSAPNVNGVNTVNLRGVAGGNVYIMTNEKHLGQEIDATLTYDYTEDVQFSLLGGIFLPGDAFARDNESRASEVIGSMKVTF